MKDVNKRKRLLALTLALWMVCQMALTVVLPTAAAPPVVRTAVAEDTLWADMLDSYNEKWTGQSENSAGSMPVGGGNLALNVWAEGDEVMFYLGSTDSIDENLVLEKLGRIRFRMSPNPFTDGEYTQELKLRQGYIEITGRNSQNAAKIDIWVDVFNGTVNVEIETEQPTTVTAVYENWRTEDGVIELPSYEEEYGGGKYMYKDTFKTVDEGRGLMFYHRNRSDVALYEDLVAQQGLSRYADQLINPLENYTFGGMMKGTDMVLLEETYTGRYASTEFTAWQMQTASPRTQTTVKIYTLFDNYASEEDFVADLMAKEAVDAADEQARQNTENWWSEFWARSWVLPNYSCTDRSDPLWQVGRHYAMTRHQVGCYALSRFPSKFNGGCFTFDPEYAGTGLFHEPVTYGTPDYRVWGGGNGVAQNQRCLTWPMLRSGDWEIMTSQFDYYKNGLTNNQIATMHYWGHDGAAFCEHITPYGLACGTIYGWDRPAYLEEGTVAASVKDQYNNQLEFTYQIMRYHDFSGEDIGSYIDFMTSSVKFYYEHYTRENLKNTGSMFDEKGKLVIYPSTAMEAFKNAQNPVDVVAALHVVVNGLIALAEEYPAIDKSYFENMRIHLPEVQYRYEGDKKVIVIADFHDGRTNVDIPELAPAWPYGVFNVGNDNITIARNTWDIIDGTPDGDGVSRKSNYDWQQTGIIAARLGLAEEAGAYLIERMNDSTYFRYPGFKELEKFDWAPNFESSSVGMTNAQEMILQDYGEDIYLLPAWPSDWELNAKLHAAYGTSVTLTNSAAGKLELLKIEQSTSARETVTLHYDGIDHPAVQVLDEDGQEVAVQRSEDAITFSVAAGRTYYVTGIPAVAPEAPEGLTVAREGDSVSNLTWTPTDGAVSYRIYRKDTQTDTLEELGETADTAYRDESLADTMGYLYRVTAVNGEGHESPPSASAVCVDTDNPLTDVTLRAGKTSLLPRERTGLTLSGVFYDGTEMTLDGVAMSVSISHRDAAELRAVNHTWSLTALMAGRWTVSGDCRLAGRNYHAEATVEVGIPEDVATVCVYADAQAANRIKVTGIGSAGQVHDLTYGATYTCPEKLITTDGAGGLQAVTDGSGTLRISVASGDETKEVLLPVRCEQGTVSVVGFGIAGMELISDSDTITEDGGTLQLLPAFAPATALAQSVQWSVVGEDGLPTLLASVNQYGFVRAHGNGKVTVRATLRDDPTIVCEKEITIVGQSLRIYEEIGFDAGKWTAGDDTWSLGDGVLSRKTSRVSEQARNFTFHEDSDHVIAKADFRFKDSRSGGYIGFHVRFDDQPADSDVPNGFIAGVTPKGQVFVMITGSGEMEEEPVDIPNFDKSQPFTLELFMVDEHVVVGINGVPMLEYFSRRLLSGSGAVSVGGEGRAMEVTNFSMQYLASGRYTLSFDARGGSTVVDQNVRPGETACMPDAPTRQGYVFEGWYLDEACTQVYDFTVAVESDLTLYAGWREVAATDDMPTDTDDTPADTEEPPATAPTSWFTIVFDSQGGSDVASQSVQDGAKASKPTDPTREGYVFDGWYLDAECTQAYDFASAISGDLTLYAKWSQGDARGCGGCSSSLGLQPIALLLLSSAVAFRKRSEGPSLKERKEK